MKKLAFLLSFVVIGYLAKAQFGVNPGLIKPSNDFGYLFKPAAAYGLVLYNTTLDERFQVSYGLSFSSFKARRDTFFSFGVQSGGGSGTKYLPAYDIWNSFYLLSGRVQGDFLILEKDFTPTLGFGLFLNQSMYDHISELQTVISLSELSNDTYLGYSLNGGVLYRVNDTYQFKLRAGRVRSKSFETGSKVAYYLFDFEFVIDFDEL